MAMMPSALIGVSPKLELRLLDDAVARAEDEVRGLAEVARREHGLHALGLAQRQHVAQVSALGRAAGLGQLVDLGAVHLAPVREEQEVVVRRAHEEVLDVVVLLEVHARDADPAPALLAVRGQRQRLDVAGVRDGDDHLLVGDQVLDVEVVLGRRDQRAPLVAVALGDLEELLLDQPEHRVLVAEQLAQLADPLHLVGVLALDRVGLERGELREAQLEDRLGLDVGEAEALDQAGAGRLAVGRRADQVDHRVEVVERDEQALEAVDLRLERAELVLGAPDDDLALVLDVVLDDALQRELARHVVDERDHVHAERGLHRRVLVELVEHDLRVRVALELDHDPHAAAVRVVLDVRDLGELLLGVELRDLADEPAVAALLTL